MAFWAAFGSEAASIMRMLAGAGSAAAAGNGARKAVSLEGAAKAGEQAKDAVKAPGSLFEVRPPAYPSPFHVAPDKYPSGWNQQPYDPRGIGELSNSAQEAGDALLNAAGQIPIIGEAVDKIATLGKAAAAGAKFLFQFGGEVLEQNRQYQRFDGAAQNAFAELDRERLRRQFETAGNVGGSAADLARSQDRLERNLRPLKDGFVNLQNRMGILTNQLAQGSLIGAQLVPVLGELLDWLRLNGQGDKDRAGQQAATAQLVTDILQGRMFPNKGDERPRNPEP